MTPIVCMHIDFLLASRVLEAKKLFVYLSVPVACVYLYNHPWFHPYLARHTPLIPPNDPEHDAELERVLEGAFKDRAARLEREQAKEQKRIALMQQQKQLEQQQRR
jgi:hypothetical protein